MSRRAQEAKRTDISKLTVEELALRRAVRDECSIILEYMREVEWEGKPLWFDCYVWLTVTDTEWVHALVDLIPDSSDRKTHAMLQRKRDYAEANDIPLLQVKVNQSMRNIIRVWVMKVKANARQRNTD